MTRIFYGLLLSITSFAQPNPGSAAPYQAAFYSGQPEMKGFGFGIQSLAIFPFSGPAVTIRFPMAISPLAQTADGKVLYARDIPLPPSGSGKRPSLYRFEIPSMRYTPVSMNDNLEVLDLAVAKDERKLVASGKYLDAGQRRCGLFEMAVPQSEIHPLLDAPSCDALDAWLELDLSPDGTRLLAKQRGGRLSIINLSQRTARGFAKGYKATWSPDGKWIAVAAEDNDDVALLNAKTLAPQRRIRKGGMSVWSPDSSSLLGSRGCGILSYAYTLESVNIATGKRRIIKSSKCKVNRLTTAWVSSGQ